MKKVLSFASSTLTSSIINFISLLLLTRLFSPEDYGTANLLISYAVVFSTVITLSVDQVIIHYYFSSKLSSILNNLFKYVLMLLPGVILFSLIVNYLTTFSLNSILLTIFYSIALVINKIFTSIFRMENAPRQYFFQVVLSKLLELMIILVIFRLLGASYEFLILPFGISILIVSSIQFRKVKKIVNEKDNLPNIRFKEQLAFSFPMFLSVIVTTATQNIDKFVLDLFVSKSSLGIYYISFKLVGIITILYTLISITWVPKAVKYLNSDDNKPDIFIMNSIRFFQLASMLIVLMYILFSEYFILLIDPSYKDSLELLDILMVIPIMMILSECFSTVITIRRNTKYHFYIALIILVINLVFSLILSKYFGTIGASYSLFITYTVLYLLRYYYFKRDLGFSYKLRYEFGTFFIIAILVTNSIFDNKIVIAGILFIYMVYFSITNYKKFNEFLNILRK